MERYSIRDALADARRSSPRWFYYPSALGGVIWAVAVLWILDRPDLSETTRTFWEILPWPFLAVGLVSWIVRERRLNEVQDEVEKAVMRQAGYISWHLTNFYAMGVILLLSSGFAFEWREIVIWPVLLYFVVFAKTHNRLVGKL
jgi:hypothetical protein